jgi:hypothetical protein
MKQQEMLIMNSNIMTFEHINPPKTESECLDNLHILVVLDSITITDTITDPWWVLFSPKLTEQG